LATTQTQTRQVHGEFLSIILRLWKILNVKSTGKGRRKRDSDMDAIFSVDDSSNVFLREVYEWLVQWEALQQKDGQGWLSNETLRYVLSSTQFPPSFR